MPDGQDIGEIILPAGLAIGGFFLAKNLLTGSKERQVNRLKSLATRAANDFEREVDDQNNISDSEIQRHIAEYKSLAKTINGNLQEGSLDINSMENELKGESAEVKALRWKQTVMLLTQERIAEVAGQNQLSRVIDDISEVVPWFEAFMKITVAGTTVLVLSKLLNRAPPRGGIMATLTTVGSYVRQGIFGDSNYVENIDRDPVPEEDVSSRPTGDPQGAQVSGSARAAMQDLGVPVTLVEDAISTVGIGASEVITLGSGALETLANGTNKSVDWMVNNPSKAILVALIIAAAVVLVVGDGPLPAGDVVAARLMASAGRIMGVALPRASQASRFAVPLAA